MALKHGDFLTREYLQKFADPELLKRYRAAPSGYGNVADWMTPEQQERNRGQAMFDAPKISAAIRAEQFLNALDQYGVSSTAELPPEVQAQLPHQGRYYSAPSGSLFQQLGDFVTSPAVLTAAAGLAGVFAGGAGAAGAAGAEGAAAGGTAAGEALGTGLTAAAAEGGLGTTTAGTGFTAGGLGLGGTGAGAGIGGGALGGGIGTGAGSAATGAGLAGAGALAPGFFASESLYPVIGGKTAAAAGTGATTGTSTQAAKSTALSRILAGNGTTEDYLTLAGQVAPSLLGAYASDKQTDALKDQAARYEAMGAPYRGRLADLYADPSAFLTSPEVTVPVQQGTDALARALSTRGNPAGSGTALSEIQNYASNQLFSRLGSEKDRLAGFGGLTAYNAAAPGAATNAIGSSSNFYNALGYGAGQVLNPPQMSLVDLMKQYNVARGLA